MGSEQQIMSAFGNVASPAILSDDFAGTDGAEWDITKWTELNGSLVINSNTGRFETGSFALAGAIYTGGSTSTVNQFQKMTIAGSGTNTYLQVIFRFTDDSSPFYALEIDINFAKVRWAMFANKADFLAGTRTWISAVEFLGPLTIDPSDRLGFTVDGVGAATIVSCWVNPNDDSPDSYDSWDLSPANVTFTDDPGGAAVDTGTKVGVAVYQQTANSLHIDEWRAGTP